MTAAVTSPTCIALRGCLGQTWCDYCGRPMPVSRAARDRLAALIAQLRTPKTPAPTGSVGTSHQRTQEIPQP